MIVENVLVLVIAGIFSMLALILTFFIGVEIVRLFREIFEQGQANRAYNAQLRAAASTSTPASKGDGPSINPFQDRDTVERLITHFEDGQGVPAAEEE